MAWRRILLLNMMVKAEDCRVVLVELKELDEALMMEEGDKVRRCEHKKVTSSIERDSQQL